MNTQNKKLCLVCSSGGHFLQLYSLKDFWGGYDHFWVTFPQEDTKHLLETEKKYWAHYPTNRNIPNLFRNILLAFELLRKERPDAVISTGAGVCVPFIFIGKILGIKTIYIESLTRSKGLSLSGRMVYWFVDHLFVQWPQLAQRCKKARFEGQVI